MSKGLYYLTAAILLALAGWLVSAPQLAGFLASGTDSAKLVQVQNGAMILKILLLADALLLVIPAIRYLINPRMSAGQGFIPLWSPAGLPAGLDRNFPAFTLALFAVLATALVLRLVSLNSDLWIDEVLTVVNFIRLPSGEIISDYSSDNHHPLFSFLAHISVALFGESAWAVRLPALIFGMASIGTAMQLALLLYGRRVAIYTGLLLALSWHHIWFSQNARGYSILLFGTLLSTLLLLRALQTGRWRFWAGYAVVIAFSAWAHITAVFVAFAHALVVLALLLKSRRFKQSAWLPVAGFILSAWLTLHLYALMLPQMLDFFAQPGAGTGVVQTEWRSPLWLISEAFRSLGIGAAFGWTGTGLVIAVAAVYAYWFTRHDWVVFLLFILPGLLLGGTMFALGRNLWPRMFFNEIGFVMMLLVVAAMLTVSFLRQRLAPRLPVWSNDLPVLVLAALMLTSLPSLYRYPKQDFTGARDYVLQHMQAGDKVVGIHIGGTIYHRYYATDWPEADNLEQLQQYESRQGHTWVLYTLPRHIAAALPDVNRYLENHYEVIRIFPGTLGDGEIVVCRSKIL